MVTAISLGGLPEGGYLSPQDLMCPGEVLRKYWNEEMSTRLAGGAVERLWW